MPVSKKRKPKAKSKMTSVSAKKRIHITGDVELTEDGNGVIFYPNCEPTEFGKQWDALSFEQKLVLEKNILEKKPGTNHVLVWIGDGTGFPIVAAFWSDIISVHSDDFVSWCLDNIDTVLDRRFCIRPGEFLTAANAVIVVGERQNSVEIIGRGFVLHDLGFRIDIDEIMSCLPNSPDVRQNLEHVLAEYQKVVLGEELPPAGGEADGKSQADRIGI